MKKGFSLVELIFALGLSLLVSGISLVMMYQITTEGKKIDNWASAAFRTSETFNALENDIKNTIALDPYEDFSSADYLYLGVTSIPPTKGPPTCENTSSFHVFGMTRIQRLLRGEKSFRLWSEVDNVNKNGSVDELRISADNTTLSLFQASKFPKEIIIVDADRRYSRRYKVNSYTMKLNFNLDPNDDLPKLDTFGNPIVFNYASIFLQMPKSMDNFTNTTKTAAFISGSEVYASDTIVVCIEKGTGNLIKINTSDSTQRVLLPNPLDEYSIKSFNVSYFSTKSGVRVDPVNFFSDMLTSANRTCVNTISLFLELEPTPALLAKMNILQAGEIKKHLTQRRTIFMQNIHNKRPIACKI